MHSAAGEERVHCYYGCYFVAVPLLLFLGGRNNPGLKTSQLFCIRLFYTNWFDLISEAQKRGPPCFSLWVGGRKVSMSANVTGLHRSYLWFDFLWSATVLPLRWTACVHCLISIRDCIAFPSISFVFLNVFMTFLRAEIFCLYTFPTNVSLSPFWVWGFLFFLKQSQSP